MDNQPQSQEPKARKRYNLVIPNKSADDIPPINIGVKYLNCFRCQGQIYVEIGNAGSSHITHLKVAHYDCLNEEDKEKITQHMR